MSTRSPEKTTARRFGFTEIADAPPKRLDNGRLAVTMHADGSGQIDWNQHAVSAPSRDRLRPGLGMAVYCRDVASPQVWSAGFLPTYKLPNAYACTMGDASVSIERMDDSIALATVYRVHTDHDLLCCHCTLANLGETDRTIQLTSYLEAVLQPAADYLPHPAFSKLFIETEWLPELGALVIRRRPRDGKTVFPQLMHFVQGAGFEYAGYESSRAAFVGRGRQTRSPLYFEDPPTDGKHGTVLDPIASRSVLVSLGAGEKRSVTFCVGVSTERPGLLQLHDLTQAGQSLNSPPEPSVLDCFAPHAPTAVQPARPPRYQLPSRDVTPSAPTHVDLPPLLYDNTFGGFADDGQEYVIRLSTDEMGQLQLPPAPWVNVIANRRAGMIVSETGASTTWVGNSRRNRLTPWSNDPISDHSGEAIYIRDEESCEFWSALPGPSPHPGDYEVRHGFGYSSYRHEYRQLLHEVTTFVPRQGACKVTRVRLTNGASSVRKVSLFAFQQWTLGEGVELPQCDESAIVSTWDNELDAITAERPGADRSISFSWASVLEKESLFAGHLNQAELFLGRCTDVPSGPSQPHAVSHFSCLQDIAAAETNGRVNTGTPAAATQQIVEIGAGETIDAVFIVGQEETRDEVRTVIARFGRSASIDAELAAVRRAWRAVASPFKLKTPSTPLNIMANGWLHYQNISCRLWGRSAFYQGGGAFGFRDQLQDAAALMYHQPAMTREQILLHAAHQFLEGDVLHWWHPEDRCGVRTKFSDDLLWLPLVTAEYVRVTGDDAIWHEPMPFLVGPPLGENQDEALMRPKVSGERGSLLEHCCRSVDRSLRAGKNGMPLMGSGDWNDGMNRVGTKGDGESVWLGFFLYHILDFMIPVVRANGMAARADRYVERQAHLKASLNDTCWDGQWFLRAFHDNGQKIGASESKECRIDALSQAWSVISGAPDRDKQMIAMQSVKRHLVDEPAELIRLLDPPFHNDDIDPGYIKGYLPGLRENGGQYTHGVLWAIRAFAELGQGALATKLLEMICPINRGRDHEAACRYVTEPYVVAADVYSQPPHEGRGGWTWYTGSAGWMFRVLFESILGITTRQGNQLVVKPCVPTSWREFSFEFCPPELESTYQVRVNNPHGQETGIREASVNGEPVTVENQTAVIPLNARGNHSVDLVM